MRYAYRSELCYSDLDLNSNYRPQRSWGKVIFSQGSVILFILGSASVHAGIPPPGKADPPWQGRPPLARRPPPWQGDPPLARQTSPGKADPPPAQCIMLGDTVNKRAVCILLECNSCFWML